MNVNSLKVLFDSGEINYLLLPSESIVVTQVNNQKMDKVGVIKELDGSKSFYVYYIEK